MKAIDTVMNFDEALMDAYENNNPTGDHAIGCRAVAKAQAEISFKAGYKQGKIDIELRTGLGQNRINQGSVNQHE